MHDLALRLATTNVANDNDFNASSQGGGLETIARLPQHCPGEGPMRARTSAPVDGFVGFSRKPG